MQDNTALVLVIVCGFGIVFMLLGIFLYGHFRRLLGRFFIIGIVNKVIDDTKADISSQVDDDFDDKVVHHTRAEIRAQAESLDFDEAVAKYTKQRTPPVQAQSGGFTEAPPKPDDSAPHIPSLRRPDKHEAEDDIYEDD